MFLPHGRRLLAGLMAFAIGLLSLTAATEAQPPHRTVTAGDARHVDDLPDELPSEAVPVTAEESDDLDGEDALGADATAPTALTSPRERLGSATSQARRLTSRHRGAPPVPPP